jgi:hypothetical protein
MAYEEYDYYNEPAGGKSLKESLYEILHGLTNEKNLRETGEGISRVRQALPGVTESVARGAIAAVPGSIGDISDFARTYAPEIMEKKFGKERFFPTTREILDYVPRMTPTHEGATTLEDVGSIISPGVGGVVKDVAMLTKGKPLGLSMIGPNSPAWNAEMEFQAKLMQAKGKTPEEIHQATGMAKGLDQQWRQEISNQFATMKGSGTFGETVMDRMALLGKDKTAEPVTLNDVFYDSKLAEAYPKLMNTEVQFTKKGSKNKGELVHTQDGYIIRVNPDLPAEKAASTILHEVQHAIQGEEGWNRGANYAEQVRKYQSQKEETISVIEELNREASKFLKEGNKAKYDELMGIRDDLAQQYIKMDPEKQGYEDYLKHGGEAESRLVQNRMKLSPEELRQYYPFQEGDINFGLDINPDEAIISTQHPRSINNPSESIDLDRKEALLQEFNKIAGGEKPVRSAVVMIGDKIFTGNTHTQAFDKAIQEGVVRKEGKKFIYPKGAEVDSDLFMLNDGSIVDRLTASRKLDVGSSEGALRDNLMQIRPANSMPVDEYMRQAKEIKKAREAEKELNYRGTHTAPYRTEDGTTAPAYEMNRTYPDDIYGDFGYRYYGHGSDISMDKQTMAVLQAAKGNPDYPITVYRAVPKEFAGEDIYTGDWITPNLKYAKQHGERFDDGYHIIEKTVPAKHMWTNADSIHEFGYDPHD